ncbi:MAG: LysR family transcriptional regulator [Solirubrobacterales bacterium]|nr:LysR family transcriptional regulator [Solirubrobacterales bacterium]
MVELRHLRYFIAVAEERNFSRAAERLHMAQSPLSAAIRQLEQEIAAELLVRSSRGVSLTSAGEVLLNHARRILETVEGAIAAARSAGAGELGTLRIGYSWSARFAILPTLAQNFASLHPDVTLITQEMWNADMPAALRTATIDVAISLCPERDGDLDYLRLRREAAVVLVPEGHRLAAASRVGWRQLNDQPFLMFPRELAPRLHDVLLEICRRAGVDPSLSSRAFHSAGDTGTLVSSDAVALAPKSVTGAVPGAVAIPLAESDAMLETYLVWHRETHSAAADKLRALARAAFPA